MSLLLAAAVATSASTTSQHTITYDGLTRQYTLVVPSGTPAALLIGIHGLTQTRKNDLFCAAGILPSITAEPRHRGGSELQTCICC